MIGVLIELSPFSGPGEGFVRPAFLFDPELHFTPLRRFRAQRYPSGLGVSSIETLGKD